jgi:hypothetical protein
MSEKEENVMTGSRKIQIGFAVLLMVGLIGLSASLWAAGYEKRLEDKAKLLKGDVWVTMNQDQKVAYIWGAGNVVDLEQELMTLLPELKVENFSAKAAEGIGDVTIDEIIAGVDSFYRTNPDKLDQSVIRVIWHNIIRPNLTTGIAGRPLQ